MAYVEMMTGTGPCGPVEMGGMFTAMMVRDNLPANVFTDTWTEVNGNKPDWYKQPSDTISYKWTGESMEPVRQPVRAAETKKAAPATGKDTRSVAPKNEIRVTVRKPSGQAAR